MMKRFAQLVSLIFCLLLLVLTPVYADEQPEPNLAADAVKAEKHPPVIPHGVQDDADGATCNGCHTGSLKMAPHPDRLNCTQCHVPGEVKKAVQKGSKKGNKK
jgi:cytochrome c-type protein NapB